MKKSLLLLFVCLFGALGGVKAWTAVNPVRTRVYCLYHPGKNMFFYASNSAIGNTNRYYGVTSNMAEVTPILIEATGDAKYNWNVSYYDNANIKGWIYENNGNSYTASQTSSQSLGVEVDNETDKKYFLRHYKSDSEKRYLNGNNDDNTCTFPTSSGGAYKDWQFIAYEDVLPSVVEAKASICASAAEASYVSGWEKVTTQDQLAQNPERYFYAFFSAVNPGVMLETYTSGTYANRLCYRTATTPTSSWTTLYELEGKGEFFAFKSCATGNYFANSSGAPWDYFANVSEYNDNCKTTISPNSGAWTIQAANEDETQWRDPVYYGSYAGSWDNYEHVGERLAANKSIERAGYFLIYRLPKSRMANVDMTALMPTGINDWTCAQGNGPAQYLQTGATETYSDNEDTYKIFKAGKIMYQTVTNMPRGKYQVTFYAVVNSANGESSVSGPNLVQAYVNDETLDIDVINQSSCTPSDYSRSITCTLDEYGSLEYGLKVKDGVTDAGNWALCKNVSLTYLGEPATDADYTALQNAINNAEDKTLGFGGGEYAPYNNVAVLNALADAKAIDPSADNLQIDVQNATAAIADENWTANATEVNNAIRWIYTDYLDNVDKQIPIGFTNGDGDVIRVSANYGDNAGLNQLNQKMCLNINTDDKAAIYGETVGYTLPLKAYTVYELTFSYAGWGGSSGAPTIKILMEDDSELKPVTLGSTTVQGNSTTEPWTSATILFQTTTAGNYKVSFGKSGNRTAFGDIELKKLPSTVSATIGENGYTTFASTYPLDLTQANLPVGVKAYKATSINSSYVHFEKLNQVVPANTGVLLEGTHGVHNIRVGSDVAEVTDNLFLVNESNDVFPAEENTTYYAMVKNSDPMTFGKFDPSVVAVPFYKAYLKVNGGSARLTVMFDEEDPTAINAIEAAEAEEGTLKDGKYLIEGKIVLVKNGVKYGTNGQKLN